MQKLGIFLKLPFWDETSESAHAEVLRRARVGATPVHIVTVTAEMLLHACTESAVAHAILEADFFLADSLAVHVWLMSRGRPSKRITGIDFAELLVQRGGGSKIAIIGGFDDVTRAVAVEKIFGWGGHVVYSAGGPHIGNFLNFNPDFVDEKLVAARPDIIFVAFGHGKQEWWIHHAKRRFNHGVIFIGVGGTIDVWGGLVTRAPTILQKMGLEWLWRLIQEPKRFMRIWRAVIVFPCRAIIDALL